MDVAGISAVVTGGASGLGLAVAHRLTKAGARVVLLDLESSRGAEVAAEMGGSARFVPGDVTTEEGVTPALDAAGELGPLRAVVHCAGRGHAMRILRKDGSPGSLEDYAAIINLNLVGSFNVVRLAAARIARTEPVDGERGASVGNV